MPSASTPIPANAPAPAAHRHPDRPTRRPDPPPEHEASDLPIPPGDHGRGPRTAARVGEGLRIGPRDHPSRPARRAPPRRPERERERVLVVEGLDRDLPIARSSPAPRAGRRRASEPREGEAVRRIGVGRDVEERREGERAVQETGVGHLEAFLFDRLPFVEEEVEVDRPRPPSLRTLASELVLRPQEQLEEGARAQLGLDRDRRVEEIGLRRPDGRREVGARGRSQRDVLVLTQPPDRHADPRFARAEVRAETDDGERHGAKGVAARGARRALAPVPFGAMSSAEPAPVLRVGQLNRFVARKLDGWREVWVEGELSDVKRAPSGHVFFNLNDGTEPAQIAVVMYRGDARHVRAKMQNGERVRVRARFSFYEPRGRMQLIASRALPAGEGDRKEQLERLKKKLAAEGLFAIERKRPLPLYPALVGLVTSRQGAALHDVVRVAAGRAPVRLVVAHCQVQGPDAAASIAAAIRRIGRLPGLEVVIVTRGGGGSEDLGAFNEEPVVRAIAACPVPVVSGVGHEVDEALADLVADVRAATPSNAAEIVVPDRAALEAELDARARRVQQALAHHLGRERLRLERLERRLADPRRALGGVRHRFERSIDALERAARGRLTVDAQRLDGLTRRLTHEHARAALALDRARLVALSHRLERMGPTLVSPARRNIAILVAALGPAGRLGTRTARARLGELAARLGSLSPLAVLSRGYAIAIHEPTGRALVASSEAAVGDAIRVRLAKGSLLAEVRRTLEPEDDA